MTSKILTQRDSIPNKAITILTSGIAISFLAFSLFVGGSKK